MISCTKRYQDFPAAHRQPSHEGHCAHIHGHNYSFEITFAAHGNLRDVNGFIVDFGRLTEVKEFLTHHFDHTLLLLKRDSALPELLKMHEKTANIRVMDDTSAEGISEFVYTAVNKIVQDMTKNRAYVRKVICFEDSKNWATFEV